MNPVQLCSPTISKLPGERSGKTTPSRSLMWWVWPLVWPWRCLLSRYVRFELSYENTHPLADRIVRLTMDYMNGGRWTRRMPKCIPRLAPKARREMNEVVSYTRVYPVRKPNVAVQIGDSYHVLENVYAVDSSFFSMFSYPLVRGSRNGLFTRPRQAVRRRHGV